MLDGRRAISPRVLQAFCAPAFAAGVQRGATKRHPGGAVQPRGVTKPSSAASGSTERGR
jgi:hypothetical protein